MKDQILTPTNVLLAANILVSLYLAFFKSYFQEKGKNIATQEDIGPITKIVEGIKSDLSTKIEEVKANLSLLKTRSGLPLSSALTFSKSPFWAAS